jgi:hypothetical protein
MMTRFVVNVFELSQYMQVLHASACMYCDFCACVLYFVRFHVFFPKIEYHLVHHPRITEFRLFRQVRVLRLAMADTEKYPVHKCPQV